MEALRQTAKQLCLSPEVVEHIDAMAEDWMLREVKKNGGTPSRLALLPFKIDMDVYPDDVQTIFRYASHIDVEWLGEYALDDGITPSSGEGDEHWIRAGMDDQWDDFCRSRSWNYGPAQYDEDTDEDLKDLWYHCEPCLPNNEPRP